MRDISADSERYMAAYAETLRRKVVNLIYWSEGKGATSDEVEQLFNLPHQSISPRFTEAKRRGEIIASGEKRLTRSGKPAKVYITPEFAVIEDAAVTA